MKTQNNATATNNAETLNPFAMLLAEYKADPTNAETLNNLATAIAFSVLKKVIDPTAKRPTTETTADNTTITKGGYNLTLVSIRRDLARDLNDLANLNRLANCEQYTITYNKDGEEQREETAESKQLADLNHKITIGDGLDLVNTAIVAIMEQTAEHGADLEKVYTIRRLKRKVWIKSEDSVNGWETVETSPIKEIFKAVRRHIDQTRALAVDPRNGYAYIEELAQDTETETETAIFRRVGKYSNLNGYATDLNGKLTFATVDNQTVYDYEELLSALNLTDRQMLILKYRSQGYGDKAIATFLGVSKQAVAKTKKQIQKKAIESGLFNAETLARYTAE